MKTQITHIQQFKKQNSDFDWQNFTHWDEASWNDQIGKALHAKTKKHKSENIEPLQTYQRLYRLAQNHEHTEFMFEAGYHSAIQVADLSRREFVKAVSSIDEISEAEAKAIHKAAVAKKSQAVLTFTNIMQQEEKHYKNARFANFSAENSGANSLPSYADLFGNVDFCSCESCRSIFSPAAYFVDMMRMQDKYITQDNPAFNLKTRRPDLWDIELSCENTNTEISKLEIVNKVLADRVQFPTTPISDPIFSFPLNGNTKNEVTDTTTYNFQATSGGGEYEITTSGCKALKLSRLNQPLQVIESKKFPLGGTSITLSLELSEESTLPTMDSSSGMPFLCAFETMIYEDLNQFANLAFLLNFVIDPLSDEVLIVLPNAKTKNLEIVGSLNFGKTYFISLVIDDQLSMKVYIDGRMTGQTVLTFQQFGTKETSIKGVFDGLDFRPAYPKNNPLNISDEYEIIGALSNLSSYKRCLTDEEINSELLSADLDYQLSQQSFPWGLPFNPPLETSRASLEANHSSFNELWKLPKSTQSTDNRAMEQLGVDAISWTIYKNSDLNNVPGYYGLLSETQLPGTLNQVAAFTSTTGLSKSDLISLFNLDLSENEIGDINASGEETSNSLRSRFFINRTDTTGKYLSIDDANNSIFNLSAANLNDINRFVRLAKQIGWSYVELNWVLNCIPGLNDIDEATLLLLAWVDKISKSTDCSIIEASALVGLLKDFGCKQEPTMFDRVFKNQRIPYAYTDWASKNWIPDNDNDDIERALAAALNISQPDAKAILMQIYNALPTEPTPPTSLSMNATTLAVCYRLSRIPKLTAFSIQFLSQPELQPDLAGFYNSLAQLNLAGTTGSYEAVTAAWTQLLELDQWMKKIHLSPGHLQFILQGTGIMPQIQNQLAGANAIKNFGDNLKLALQQTLITAKSFNSLTPSEANTLLKALTSNIDSGGQPCLVSIGTPSGDDPNYSCIINSVPSINQIKAALNKSQTSDWPNNWPVNVHNSLLKKYQLQLKSFDHTVSKIAGLPSAYVQDLVTLTNISIKELLTGTAQYEIHLLQQYATLIKFLALSPAELSCILNYPDLFSLEHDKKDKSKIPFNIDNLKSLVIFKQLIHEFGDTQNHLINAMIGISQVSKSSESTDMVTVLAKAIADISQWNESDIQLLLKTVWKGEKIGKLNSIGVIYGLKEYIDKARAIGVSIKALQTLIGLDVGNFQETNQANQILESGLQSTPAVSASVMLRHSAASRKRNALVPWVMHQLNQSPDFDEVPLKASRDLYEYLLIDVEVDGIVQTSRVREAIGAVQLYLYRCMNNMEACSINADLKNRWSWVEHYRTWQANREVFLYPENYIEPQLRKVKSPGFDRLESSLQQINLTDPESVDQALLDYIESFFEVADLIICGAAGANTTNGLTTFLVGRTKGTPSDYYYLTGQFSGKNDDSYVATGWTYWKPIDTHMHPITDTRQPLPSGISQIGSDYQNIGVRHDNGLWQIYWSELFTKPSIVAPDPGKPPYQPDSKPRTKYATLRSSGKWSKAMDVSDDQTSVLKSDNKKLDWNIFNGLLQLNDELPVTGVSIPLVSSAVNTFQKNLASDGVRGVLKGSYQFQMRDFKVGPISAYYWELFFYAPFMVANALNKALQFKAARKWYQYIFDPTAQKDTSSDPDTDEINNNQYWKFLPLKKDQNTTLNTEHSQSFVQNLKDDLANAKEMKDYHEDPYDPHAIARLRPIAYQKVMVMQYINNLITWGDSLFKQYTRESIDEAETYYIMAYDLLGKKPVTVASPPLPKPLSLSKMLEYEEIEPKSTEKDPRALKNVKEFLIQIEQAHTGLPSIGSDTPANYIPGDYFGIPENEHFQSYWSTVRQRLYDIRHGLNINGAEEALPLFQPPVNPMALVSQIAAGESVQQALSPFGAHTPVYRFKVVIQKAKEMLGSVIQLGQSLMAALEKKDAEALQLLLNINQQHIQTLTLAGKQENINQVQANVAAMQTSLKSAQTRVDHYNALISAGLISQEKDQVGKLKSAMTLQETGAGIRAGAVVAKLLPNIFGFSDGGMDWGGSIGESAAILDSQGNIENVASGMSAAQASFARRLEDWNLQLELAQDDIVHLTSQIHATQYQLRIIQQEQAVLQTSITQAQKVEAFYKNKFTSQQLYDWMIGKASTLYFQAYQHAVDLGLQAQNAWTFEKGLDSGSVSFIQHQQWDNLHQGLLAGNALQLDLQRMESDFMKKDTRRLEITKTIALSTLPSTTGKEGKTLIDDLKAGEQGEPMACTINLTQTMFDNDYMGMYCRLIKSVSVSIPAVIGPYENIRATLTQTSNNYKNSPKGQAIAGPASREKIALSGGINDTGMFQLNYNDERYLPFEGTGVISNWDLEILNDNLKDRLSDVILEIRYTALG